MFLILKEKQTKQKQKGCVICQVIQLSASQRELSGYFPWGKNEMIYADSLRKRMIVCLLERPEKSGVRREAEQSRLSIHIVHNICNMMEKLYGTLSEKTRKQILAVPLVHNNCMTLK